MKKALWASFSLALATMACGAENDTFSATQSAANDCRFYCAVITKNCTESARQYASLETCADSCLRFPPGDADGAPLGNTLACRLFNAMAGSSAPARRIFCNNAGPSGGLMCRDL